jgi:hypothetical protein
MRRFSNRLGLWWRRPARRPRGLVVIGASTECWTPLTLSEQSQSVPGAQGQGRAHRGGVVPASAPSLTDMLTHYQHFLAVAHAGRVPMRTAQDMIPLTRKLPHGPVYSE